ncbi:glycerophosphodiester phosphodiesterase [Vulgatibacter incomptus]|uniref:Glycerophosphoryl diester phosphodiesterase n=1 Tax=Vulgatibacter incomptus TaxID=1391653 RepID=A0A0K1P9W7_9BACT|nr:glycerophosphodiester phosphodiesterase [Vulgatibacter incomptus]AKU90206.1 Glycerophosphoryl diester phosphodiesterase [Vulgatibacter incomptus]
MHPYLRGLRPTLHISHRGGAALAPENTLVAFRQAIDRYSTAMLELDVQGTADGELVVFHDDTLDRCTEAKGPVAERTLAELRALDAGYRFTIDGGATFPWRGRGVRIPTLREVIEDFPGTKLHVELKPDRPEVEPAFASLVRGEPGRFCVGSEHDRVAHRLSAALPDACLFYPRIALTELVTALRLGIAPPRDDRFLVIDMPLSYDGVRLVSRDLLEKAAALGKWVNVWTVDDPEEMRRLVDEGVGGIMSDRPDLLREVLDEAEAG